MVHCVVGAQTIGLIQIAIVSYFGLGFVCFQANLLETSVKDLGSPYKMPVLSVLPSLPPLFPEPTNL